MKINHLPPAKQNLVVETLREPENAQYENITYDYIEKHITEFRSGCPRSIMINLQWLRQIRNYVKNAVFLADSLKSLENFRLEGLLFPDGSRSFIVKDSFRALFKICYFVTGIICEFTICNSRLKTVKVHIVCRKAYVEKWSSLFSCRWWKRNVQEK